MLSAACAVGVGCCFAAPIGGKSRHCDHSWPLEITPYHIYDSNVPLYSSSFEQSCLSYDLLCCGRSAV